MGEQYTDILDSSDISLLETIDHVLNRGLVIAGDITISVADIDLIYMGLNVVLGSVDTINKALGRREGGRIVDGPVNDSAVGQSNQADS